MSFSFDVKEDILKFNMETSSHLVEVEAWLRFAGEIIISMAECGREYRIWAKNEG